MLHIHVLLAPIQYIRIEYIFLESDLYMLIVYILTGHHISVNILFHICRTKVISVRQRLLRVMTYPRKYCPDNLILTMNGIEGCTKEYFHIYNSNTYAHLPDMIWLARPIIC